MGEKPDILLFLSDQHTPYYTGYFGGNVDTPNMDDMAQKGVNFSACYAACPLCVPSRMSMLSTLMPYKTGVYTNGDTLSDTLPTFLHPLVANGYETVLIGRMHFIGADQRHGFTGRIAPDITPTTWGEDRADQIRQRGRLYATFVDYAATKVVGSGESPVIHYDRMVVDKAMEYLAEEHDKPQCIVVGTYGPHFPYIADPDLFEKYYAKCQLPETFDQCPGYMNELLLGRQREVTEDVARGCVAAYCAQVELQDRLLGEVRSAFADFCSRRNSKRVMAYLSDHGDQVGDRRIYGKNTFFEKSVRVPLLVEGDGIAAGYESKPACSLLDVGPTIWELTGSKPLAETDGISLADALQGKEMPADRVVLSELFEKKSPMPGELPHYARMAISGGRKYITYHGYEEQDMVFDVDGDPLELQNRFGEDREADRALKQAAAVTGDPAALTKRQIVRSSYKKLFVAYEQATQVVDQDTWTGNPESARGQLVHEVSEPWDGFAERGN